MESPIDQPVYTKMYKIYTQQADGCFAGTELHTQSTTFSHIHVYLQMQIWSNSKA